ncbi:hypothetical protein GPALN_004854 [Globodera pallida]|nr:hypothetical protein GPALN_004854 [Globodera pallida]
MFKFLLFLTSFFFILFGTTHSMFEELSPNKMRRNNSIGVSGTASSAWPSSFTGAAVKRNSSTGNDSERVRPPLDGANKPKTISQTRQQPLSPLHAYFPYNNQPNSPMSQVPRVTNFNGCIPEGFKNLLLRSKSTVDRNKNGESLRKCNTYPSDSKKFESSSKEKQNNEESEQKQSKEDKLNKLKDWWRSTILRKGNKNEISKSEAKDKSKANPSRKCLNFAENKAANKQNIEEFEFSFPSRDVINTPEAMTPLRLFKEGSANSSGRKPELSVFPQVEQNDGQWGDEIVM